MIDKYRVKLNSGRVIGPIGLKEVATLLANGHAKLSDDYQVFPDGAWESIESFEKLQNHLNNIKQESDLDQDATQVRLSTVKSEKEKPIKEEFHEFKYSLEEKEKIVTYEELEKNYNPPIINEKSNPVEHKSLDKTIVIKRDQIEPFDKTFVLDKNKINEEFEKEINKDEKKASLEEFVEPEPVIDPLEEKTKVISLSDIKGMKSEYLESEKELIISDTPSKDLIEAFDDSEEIEVIIPKKKMKPIVAFAFIVILYFLFIDDDEQKIYEPQFVKLSAPITLETTSANEASSLYQEGMRLYKKGNYLNRVKASNYFKRSVENEIIDNPALGMLVLSYSELIENAADKKRASRTLFNLIKITRSKMFTDINVAMGSALFYKHVNKIQTSLNIIENYLRISKPSLKLLGIYFDCAIEAGDLILANKIYTKVEAYPNKPLEIYLALSKYHNLDEQYDKGEETILDGLKTYGSSIALMLELASYKLRKENIKAYTIILKKIEQFNYEGNPSYYAKYLEYVALLSALNKDNKKAAILFKAALKINNSDTLRGKLAGLDIGGGRISERLILESKAIDYVRRSKKLARQKRWREAFSAALSATNLGLSYLPADLNLVNLQIKRGYYEFAINKLEKLKAKYPRSARVKFYLIEAKTKANKLAEAQTDVSYATTTLSRNRLYFPVVARFYERSKRYNLAMRYLNKSVVLNPLRDEDYFLMAKIYMKSRQYKEAKSRLNDAINLDPLNTDYISFYSKIIYELDGAETAIGYLRDQLKENVDNPQLMGNIASYYYNSGQVAKFEESKKEVEKLNSDDENFYRFLIEAAKIEENQDALIKNSIKLLAINPGDLETRMTLARYYAKVLKYNEALTELDEVIERLSTYPQAYYLKAKIYLMTKNTTMSLKMAQSEITSNPEIYYGWYIQGETHRLMKNYNEAIKSLEKAISIEPKSVDVLKSLGWIKLNQRHFDIARELYLRAKKRAGNDPEIRKQLGYIYKGIGQSVLAIEEFETYLKLYPNAPDRVAIKKQILLLTR